MPRPPGCVIASLSIACCLELAAVVSGGCATPRKPIKPSIAFTRVPPADRGGPEIVDTLEGRVLGARAGQQLVLFAHSLGVWWVQPGPEQAYPGQPYTPIRADSTWTSAIHLGTEYAAALVEPGYRPPRWVKALPEEGPTVAAVAVVPGNSSSHARHPTLQFSGYDWLVRASPSDRGGQNSYDPANAWTDDAGALHLRIARSGDRWTCAQVILTRSLGYGTYQFVVRDISGLDPAAVLALYTLDDVGAAATDRNPREWDVEFSRWGDGRAKNAQYVLQPRYLAANTTRFQAPGGRLTHTLTWEPGRISFTTTQGDDAGKTRGTVAEHASLTSVPMPGSERFRINFYDFQRGPSPLARAAEIVIEKFTYLP